jgi:oxaloacetate decarboxylase (Na+ extruding) subunit alpha
VIKRLREQVQAEIARTGRRRRIALTDATLRDAHQCLWATRMRTEHMLPIAEQLDAAGYDLIEGIALAHFDTCVLFLQQDPIERVRLLAERIRRTPMRAGVRSNLMRGFYPVAADVTEFFVERLAANGVRNMVFLESLFCWDNVAGSIAAAKRLGVKVSVPLLYSLAPGYDDAFFVAKAREAVERFDVDEVIFGDAGGSLMVERARKLVPAVKQAIGERTLEVVVHCLNAVGPQVALEAAVLGADRLLCAPEPMANGNSVPSAQMLARDLRELGFEVDVDVPMLDAIGEHFVGVAEREGFPLGVPAEYDPAHLETQYAGGAMSNLEAQLVQAGIADKLPQVLAEIAQVRVELGSPAMATPFPAIVAAQAVMNVLSGERYRVVPDEVKKYACGYFGALPVPIDPNIKDRIIANGSREIAFAPPVLEPLMPGLRRRYGHLSEDQMLLRYMYGDQKIDALIPTKVSPSAQQPLVELIAGLARSSSPRPAHIHGSGFEVLAR